MHTAPASGPLVLVAMGVSGCGKSSFGREFARWRGAPFLEGDDFHPARNVARMRAGLPLGDAERWPWLDALADAARNEVRLHGMAVASCSALKRSYRDRLRARIGLPVYFAHLVAPREELARRIAARAGHYMPVSLLESQLATLQAPVAEEGAITLDATQPLAALLERAAALLGLPQAMAPGSSPPAK